MNKLYDRIIWVNDTTPALNEDNLNAMSKGIDDIDDRVLELGAGVLEVIPELEALLENAEQIIHDTEGYAEAAGQSADAAQDSADDASDSAEDSEAYAVGTRGGTPVDPTDPTYHNNAKWYSEQANPTALTNLTDVNITNPTAGEVLKYNSTTQKWENGTGGGGGGTSADDVSYDNTSSGLTATNVQDAIDEVVTDVGNLSTEMDDKHTSTTLAVSLTGWATDTTSQSGTTLYKKQISLTSVYVESPSVDIGAGTGYVLPTSAEQESYNLIQYVTVDDTVPCLYLYASEIPTTAFYIKVVGVE